MREADSPLPAAREWLLLAGIMALGFLVRITMSVAVFTSSRDTSTVGLMAMDILQGARPLFYYGQSYMGALEAYVTALIFRIFGVTTVGLTLAPIVFACGWIAATYLLFRNLFGPRGGAAAALCVALPGLYPLWYSIGPYGGYPETFLLGTLVVFLSLRMHDQRLTGRVQWGRLLSIGFLAALALWINFQVAPYLVTGAVILFALWRERKFDRRWLLGLVAAAAVAAVGVLPFLLTPRGLEDPPLFSLPGPESLGRNWRIFIRANLPQGLFWPVTSHTLLRGAIVTGLALAAGMYLWRLVTEKSARRLKFGVPLLFVGVFLLLYLPHPLAGYRAPRYLIPAQTMLLGAIFAAAVTMPRRFLRGLGWSLLSLWLLYNGSSVLRQTVTGAPEKARREEVYRRIIGKAKEAGLRNVMIVGSRTDGNKGLIFSFYAHKKVNFVSAYDDRVHASLISWEHDPRGAYTIRRRHLGYLTQALKQMGVQSYRVIEDRSQPLIYDIEPSYEERVSLPPGEIQVVRVDGLSGEAESLVDRDLRTGVESRPGTPFGVTVDLGAERLISGFWLRAANAADLPYGYQVRTSRDGIEYEVVQEVPKRIAASYIAGNRVYFKGYFAKLESRFPPVEARYLSLSFPALPPEERVYRIHELFLFEHRKPGTAVSEDEVRRIAGAVVEKGIDFAICDRWLSARLADTWSGTAGRPEVFPVYNRRQPSTLRSREVRVASGLGMIVDRALAGEALSLLRGALPREVSAAATEFPHYTLITFADVPGGERGIATGLTWEGHLPLRDR